MMYVCHIFFYTRRYFLSSKSLISRNLSNEQRIADGGTGYREYKGRAKNNKIMCLFVLRVSWQVDWMTISLTQPLHYFDACCGLATFSKKLERN